MMTDTIDEIRQRNTDFWTELLDEIDRLRAANKKQGERVESVRQRIEGEYEHVRLGSGAVGGDFGSILCHELHHGGEGHGLHFTRLAAKWGIPVSLLGEVIADHCRLLEPTPALQGEDGG
jgi:hypothetical protein